jgi:hypothetical protein
MGGLSGRGEAYRYLFREFGKVEEFSAKSLRIG